ncbi:DMT family transporter [Polymorphobacter arshaanensis]|uniref:DMT family transporter n=2 Tax=Glacieibacterium arshaanense TaxID=2511025 RepID=A0A4Y9ERG1_9SPHN|nr:DMT family transporter [Polymorphobacter arshaanensis]
MSLRDLALLIAICLVWGLSNVVSKIVVGQWGVAPLFYTALRFAVVLAVTFPWLLPAPRPIWRILMIGVLMGGGNFALLFMGLQTASPSAAAIVLQLGVPITTLLSVFMLGERIHWRRALGIALTMAGALTVIWHPEGVELSYGLWLIAGATVVGSLGGIMMKQMEGVAPLRFQAWVALASLVPMALGSLLFEHNQWPSAMAAGWPFVGAVAFTALIVSVVGHTAFYGLIQRYEANLIAPLTLMAPLATIAFGVLITHDHFDMRMAIGAALALTGVLIVALRRNHVAPLLLLLREEP